MNVTDICLRDLYANNGLFAKIIDFPAEEAVRRGFFVKGVSRELETFYREVVENLRLEEIAADAIKWARLFGGSMIVLLANDGNGLEDPLNWETVRSVDAIRVYDRSRIRETDFSGVYQVSSVHGSFSVHESRCLIFRNGELPERASDPDWRQWGTPEYARICDALQDVETVQRSTIKMLQYSGQSVLKVKGLAAELSTEEGEEKLLRRLEAIDMARGLFSSIAVDKVEDFSFHSFRFSGVSDVVNTACAYLSAVTYIPQTILFGRRLLFKNQIGSFTSANDSMSFPVWYGYIERLQERMLRGNLYRLLSIIFRAGYNSGQIKEIPAINLEFAKLWSMDEMEKAQIELDRSKTELLRAKERQVYHKMGAITSEEIRRSLLSETKG